MRITCFAPALALLALGGALPTAAQQFIPQPALVAMLEVHKASILAYLDAAPDSMLGWRPVPGVRTFAEQIQHAAWGDAFIAHSAITGNMRVPSLGDSLAALKSKAALKAYTIAAMDHTIEMVRAVPEAAMTQEITQFGKRLPRYRALMELLDHFPFTLGQVVPYLRIHGVKPPTYTPF